MGPLKEERPVVGMIPSASKFRLLYNKLKIHSESRGEKQIYTYGTVTCLGTTWGIWYPVVSEMEVSSKTTKFLGQHFKSVLM